MQVENDYDKEVYNGDIGNIDSINPADGELDVGDGSAVEAGALLALLFSLAVIDFQM